MKKIAADRNYRMLKKAGEVLDKNRLAEYLKNDSKKDLRARRKLLEKLYWRVKNQGYDFTTLKQVDVDNLLQGDKYLHSIREAFKKDYPVKDESKEALNRRQRRKQELIGARRPPDLMNYLNRTWEKWSINLQEYLSTWWRIEVPEILSEKKIFQILDDWNSREELVEAFLKDNHI